MNKYLEDEKGFTDTCVCTREYLTLVIEFSIFK